MIKRYEDTLTGIRASEEEWNLAFNMFIKDFQDEHWYVKPVAWHQGLQELWGDGTYKKGTKK